MSRKLKCTTVRRKKLSKVLILKPFAVFF
jgi:hypothetical protein